jgi:hypothetical protein
MEIKVGGVYRTRGGDRVIINCIGENLGDFWPIKGVVVRDHNEYHSWCLKGRHLSANQESWLDLVALWEDEEVAAPYPSAPNEVPTATLVTSGGKCESPDAVFRPNHYTRLYPEPITVINAWGLNFNLGSAVKYIARNGHKGENTAEQDLSKAKRYIEIELERLRREKAIESGEATRSLLVETL